MTTLLQLQAVFNALSLRTISDMLEFVTIKIMYEIYKPYARMAYKVAWSVASMATRYGQFLQVVELAVVVRLKTMIENQ